jgi:hypothetical protein
MSVGSLFCDILGPCRVAVEYTIYSSRPRFGLTPHISQLLNAVTTQTDWNFRYRHERQVNKEDVSLVGKPTSACYRGRPDREAERSVACALRCSRPC